MSDIADALRAGGLYDGGGRLLPAGQEVVLDELARTRFDGRPAYVAVVDGDPRQVRAVWDELGLDPERDLLLILGEGRWEARGWGLDDADIARILDEAEPAMAQGVGPAVSTALKRLAVGGSPAAIEWVGFGAAGLGATAVAVGLGWLVARRRRVARTERTEQTARSAVEDAVAQLVLTADELGEPGRALQDRADRLRRELRNLRADEAHEVRVARMLQLENEVAALQSEVLQTQRQSSVGPMSERRGPPQREIE